MFMHLRVGLLIVAILGLGLAGCTIKDASSVAQGDADEGLPPIDSIETNDAPNPLSNDASSQVDHPAPSNDPLPEQTLPANGFGSNAGGLDSNADGFNSRGFGNGNSDLQGDEKKDDAPVEMTADDYRQQAMQQVQARNLAGALASLEKAIKLAPQDRQLKMLFAQVKSQRGIELFRQGDKKTPYDMFIELGKFMKKFHEDYQDTLTAQEKSFVALCYYNQACGYAVQEQPEKSLAKLKEAIETGFTDLEQIRKDDDFASLRDREEFKGLLAECEKKIEEKKREEIQQKLAENESFPFHFKLPDLEGQPVSLDEFKGNVVIVDFWGTWCPPCRQEIPHFIELKKKYGDKGLAIVGINYERAQKEEAKKLIKTFVEEQGVNYPCVIGDQDTAKQVPDFGAIPTTLFIDRKGKVRLKLVGYHPIEELEAVVTELLKEPSE